MEGILYDVVYDGFSFRDNGLVLTDINHMQVAQRNNQIEPLANVGGGELVQSLLGIKNIPMMGYYIGSSVVDAQQMYDTLVQALNKQQRSLEVPHAGGTRKFVCTPESIVIQQPDGLNKITFSLEFVVPKGYAIADEDSILLDTNVTTSTSSESLSVIGSVKARPVINVTVNSVSGGTGGTLEIRNARDLIGVSISYDFVGGEEITIDSENFQITIDGVRQEPDGRMPTWEPGTGGLYYSDSFSARDVDIYGTYKPKNL